MVILCLEYFNNVDIIEKCERFEYVNDYEGYWFVIFLSINEIYKNVDCVFCNVELMNLLKLWDIKFYCKILEEIN